MNSADNESKKEIYILGGDLNIDSIANKDKVSSEFWSIPEINFTDFFTYYSESGIIDQSKEVVTEYLKLRGRYGIFMAILNSGTLRFDNLFYCKNKKIEATYGPAMIDTTTGKTLALNTALVDPVNSMSEQCLDYFFLVQPEKLCCGSKSTDEALKVQNSTSVRLEDVKIRHFEVDGFPFTQLSDHSGLEVNLLLNI